jgi:pimeloyl-ACP methyl ester carboxylesterase
VDDRAEVGVPERSTVIDVDGVKLAIAREGCGPAVVCLHAIGQGGRDFEAFTEAMKSRFEIIRIDWPGQGRSGDDHHPFSTRRYADLLAGVLTRLNVERPIIIGNSIGGAAAIIYASREPVRGLVLCDSAGLVPVSWLVRTICGAFVKFFRAGVRRAWWFKPAFAFYYGLVLTKPAARAQRRRIVASCYEIAPLLVQAFESATKPEADLRGLAAAFTIPVWFAWAKDDRVVLLSLCLPAIRAMKTATLTRFAGGHAPFLEQPEAFVAGFEAFVAGLDTAPVAMRLSPPPSGPTLATDRGAAPRLSPIADV